VADAHGQRVVGEIWGAKTALATTSRTMADGHLAQSV
jgi:hypothetical protein